MQAILGQNAIDRPWRNKVSVTKLAEAGRGRMPDKLRDVVQDTRDGAFARGQWEMRCEMYCAL
ncbi:hypothetical protein D3C87_1603910 [compost metagenome]